MENPEDGFLVTGLKFNVLAVYIAMIAALTLKMHTDFCHFLSTALISMNFNKTVANFAILKV